MLAIDKINASHALLNKQHEQLSEVLLQIKQFEANFDNLDTRTSALNELSETLDFVTSNEENYQGLNSLLVELKNSTYPELDEPVLAIESLLTELSLAIDKAEEIAAAAKERLTPQLLSDVLGQKMRTAYSKKRTEATALAFATGRSE
jgi:hypothetical protein